MTRREVIRGGDPDRDTCEVCGGPRPPDSTVYAEGDWLAVCPSCEDRLGAAADHDHPPGDPGGVPPHGNTTR